MAPYYVEYYSRMTYPLISPVLCLFAFALAISFERQARTESLMACLLVLFSILICLVVSEALGNGKRYPHHVRLAHSPRLLCHRLFPLRPQGRMAMGTQHPAQAQLPPRPPAQNLVLKANVPTPMLNPLIPTGSW
ncbi:MAG: LptF/LptG family permease [Bdellovibrionaceae bacterium]|nr:LptF/LptG family permease [Pseudobdellovibrionaceae bacterium]